MQASFLDVELSEMALQADVLEEAEFNAWFDKSSIKARFKKACMQQQSLRCCYCQRYQDNHNNNLWDLEHILCEDVYPQFFSQPLNLAVACKRCNIAKRQKDVLRPPLSRSIKDVPDRQMFYNIPHPHLSNWSDHIRHTAYLIYESLTPEGEELKACCQLNGAAEEKAGLTVGAIETAISTGFFKRVRNIIPAHVAEIDAVAVTRAATETLIELQYEQTSKKLKKALADYERKARRRASVTSA
jgi:hypothetical protein